jgi:hypothetical protein
LLQSGVDLTNVKMGMNPFCEIAVEVRGWLYKVLLQQRLPCAGCRWQWLNRLESCKCTTSMAVILQEALRLRESKAVEEVVAVSLGPQQVQVRAMAWHAAAAHSHSRRMHAL